jgi:hypothetical protein
MVSDSNPRIRYAVFVSHVITNTFPPPDSLEFQETTDVSRIAQTDDRQASFVISKKHVVAYFYTSRELYAWHIVLVNLGVEGMLCRYLLGIRKDVYNKCDTDALVGLKMKIYVMYKKGTVFM